MSAGKDDLISSPDGESRGRLFRIGDLFPLYPIGQVLAADPEGRSTEKTRPWGLRYAYPINPIEAGKHSGKQTKDTSGGTPDGKGPTKEEVRFD